MTTRRSGNSRENGSSLEHDARRKFHRSVYEVVTRIAILKGWEKWRLAARATSTGNRQSSDRAPRVSTPSDPGRRASSEAVAPHVPCRPESHAVRSRVHALAAARFQRSRVRACWHRGRTLGLVRSTSQWMRALSDRLAHASRTADSSVSASWERPSFVQPISASDGADDHLLVKVKYHISCSEKGATSYALEHIILKPFRIMQLKSLTCIFPQHCYSLQVEYMESIFCFEALIDLR